MAETVDSNGVIPYTDRLNYVSSLINNMGYCMALEKLLGISVPERCHYMRGILSGISRITDHLTVRATAVQLGAFTVFLYMIKAREYLWELVEKATGARMTVSHYRVGGVKGDLPEDFAEPCRKAFEEPRKLLAETNGLLTRNHIFADRMSGTGLISTEDAISCRITGPFLRATGADYDVRKDCPYAVYDRLPFDVPVGVHGHNMDRYLGRMEEMEQSVRIVERALRDMPLATYERRVFLPAKEDTSGDIRRAHAAIQAGDVRPWSAAAEGGGLLPYGRGKRRVRILHRERRNGQSIPSASPSAMLCDHVGAAQTSPRGHDGEYDPHLRVGQHDRRGS